MTHPLGASVLPPQRSIGAAHPSFKAPEKIENPSRRLRQTLGLPLSLADRDPTAQRL